MVHSPKSINMNTIKIWNDSPSDRQIHDIAERILDGAIAIIPTDTMYAIVGDALNPKAIERICRLKGINPEKTNLSIICSDISMAAEYARIENAGYRILKEYTPGPFTLLFRSASSLPRAFKGRKVVGIRIPDCTLDRMLAEYIGHPLITTTIEYEDEDYARNPQLIAETYENQVDLMVEGDEGTTGLSTIIDCTGSEPEIIRQGIGIL